MKAITLKRKSWAEALASSQPLLLPAAHDALAARIIERAGFHAYQVGGFALVGAMHAVPDVDLEHFGEKSDVIENVINASPLPVLVDADDGYGDAKNVTRTVRSYIRIGASAMFIEDQMAPKLCGHMTGQKLVPATHMVNKIKAAIHARQDHNFFLLARTDAIGAEGLDEALRRGEQYLNAGADGIYVEGPSDEKQLRKIGKVFDGVPLATSVLENGGKTPWLSPEEFKSLGFSMILYPTTILFQVTKIMQLAAENLRKGKPLDPKISVDLEEFEDIVETSEWKKIEKMFSPSSHKDE
jgi:methylisocitrate lyase